MKLLIHMVRVFRTILFLMLSIFFLLLILPHCMGMTCGIVLSGSMMPAIPVGSLCYINPTSADNICIGDVIAFSVECGRKTMKVIHRVIDKDDRKQYCTTKGDYNEEPDVSPVSYTSIQGKVVLVIPYLGRICRLIFTYKYVLVGAALLFEAMACSLWYALKNSAG